jgi:hypothetical protein
MTPAVRRVLWCLAVAFVLHEAEEWNLGDWERATFTPPPDVSDAELRTLLVAFAALGFGFTALALTRFRPRTALLALLPLYVTVIFGNALTHIHWSVRFGGYTPGVVTAALLLAPLTVALVTLVLRERAAPRAYVAVLLALSLLQPLAAAALGAGYYARLWGAG